MANNNKKGGGNNIIADAFGFILAVGIFIAIFVANGENSINLSNIGEWSRKKSFDMQNCYTDKDCLKINGKDLSSKKNDSSKIDGNVNLPNIDGNTDFPNIDKEVNNVKGKKPNIKSATNTIGEQVLGTYQEASKKLDGLMLDKGQKVEYDRSEWRHWISAGSSCWNTREEVLYRDAKVGSTILLDKSKKETKNKKEACYIIGGQWEDPYSRDVITDPKKIDIDHVIPLKYVATHGGQDWDKDKKEAYANDYEGLLAVSATENRKKSDKGPEEYMPPNIEFHCDYSKQFIYMAYKYNISITEGDKKVLKKGLNACAS